MLVRNTLFLRCHSSKKTNKIRKSAPKSFSWVICWQDWRGKRGLGKCWHRLIKGAGGVWHLLTREGGLDAPIFWLTWFVNSSLTFLHYLYSNSVTRKLIISVWCHMLFSNDQPSSAKFSQVLPISSNFIQVQPSSVQFCLVLASLTKFTQFVKYPYSNFSNYHLSTIE